MIINVLISHYFRFQQLLAGLIDVFSTLLKTFTIILPEKSIFKVFFTESNISLLGNLTKEPDTCHYVLPLIQICFQNVYNLLDLEEMKLALNYSIFIDKILSCLDSYNIMLKSSEIPYMTSFKLMIEPCGINKLTILMIMKELLSKNDKEIETALLKTSIIKECISMIFKYQWNNLLHCLIEELFIDIIKNKKLAFIRQVTNWSLYKNFPLYHI